jgi:hypothetical protein
VNPDQFAQVAAFEARWKKTIARKGSIAERADAGRPYAATADAELCRVATAEDFTQPIVLEPGAWVLPAGAFGDGCGPS